MPFKLQHYRNIAKVKKKGRKREPGDRCIKVQPIKMEVILGHQTEDYLRWGSFRATLDTLQALSELDLNRTTAVFFPKGDPQFFIPFRT